MSKFAYKADGELNSNYVLELIKEYLNNALTTNETNGIDETSFKINYNSPYIFQKLKNKVNKIRLSANTKDNYFKIQTTERIKHILNSIDIFSQTNVLAPSEVLRVENTLRAVGFEDLIPQFREDRARAIYLSEKKFKKVNKEIAFLEHALSEYALFVSPVNELKSFLSDKVSVHCMDRDDLKTLVKEYLNLNYEEINNFEAADEIKVTFDADNQNYSNVGIIQEAGFGIDIEKYIREKLLEKESIMSHAEELIEDREAKCNEVDMYLKKLKVLKIEKNMERLNALRKSYARSKESIEKCKEIINLSTIVNKDNLFLNMDAKVYKLRSKCEKLAESIKAKIQAIDKQKFFEMVEMLDEQAKSQIKPETKDYSDLNADFSKIRSFKSMNSHLNTNDNQPKDSFAKSEFKRDLNDYSSVKDTEKDASIENQDTEVSNSDDNVDITKQNTSDNSADRVEAQPRDGFSIFDAIDIVEDAEDTPPEDEVVIEDDEE